ncbi:MAG: DUF2071 domain-containing protein [Actinocatenispora sp.]
MRPPPSPQVRRPVMMQRWTSLTFLHWRYPAVTLQPLLPPGLRVEECDGAAWVSLVPFRMEGVRLPGLPTVPWLSRFPETNLRTYVVGPAGAGIWFLSLDAARLPVVSVARTAYGLPYQWSSMSLSHTGNQVSYRSRRRWPDAAGARCDVRVAWGDRPDDELGPLDHFLTARYRLYSVLAGRLVTVPVEHPPWPLRRATLRGLDEDLTTAAGLPAPSGEPVLHASGGVPVRIGGWHRT